MTLTKAIEAAREALKYLTDGGIDLHVGEVALAALPDKPMTEDEIIKIIQSRSYINRMTAINILRALKAVNVLYVEEKQK